MHALGTKAAVPVPPHPGEALRETLEKAEMTPAELAARIASSNCPAKRIEQIVEGRALWSAKLAIDFEEILGQNSAEAWMQLKMEYEIALTRKSRGKCKNPKPRLGDVDWLANIEEPMRRLLVANHRECILDGEVAAVVREGIEANVIVITEEARTSRATLYCLFESREACVRHAFIRSVEEVVERVGVARGQGFAGLAEWAEEHRDLLRFCLVEGPRIDLGLYAEMLDRLSQACARERWVVGVIVSQLHLRLVRGEELAPVTQELPWLETSYPSNHGRAVMIGGTHDTRRNNVRS